MNEASRATAMTMKIGTTESNELFDDWPDRYDAWFATPIGAVVQSCETDLLIEMLNPQPGEVVLDIGCGTGIFTIEVFRKGPARIIGVDLSLPMLHRACRKTGAFPFSAVGADMCRLPFADNVFDRVYSMTALEFVAAPGEAIAEMNRVARPGATIVVTTLNSLSPWAARRKQKAEAGHELFTQMTFRSPEEMCALIAGPSKVRTAVHFGKNEPPRQALHLEAEGMRKNRNTGAMVALAWCKS